MFVIKQFLLLLLFTSLNGMNFIQNLSTRAPQSPTTKKLPRLPLNRSTKILNTSFSTIRIQNDETSITFPEDPIDSTDTITDEFKSEVSVNDLLDTVEEADDISQIESHKGPHYEIDWNFINKDTIRVVFDLFSVPTSLIENNRNSEMDKHKSSLLATMALLPSRSLKSITLLKYFLFIIRPYHKHREIVLKMEKLIVKNTTSRKYHHFSNILTLTALNHNEKYSICICYYQTNTSTKTPDLVLCQDIINDYAKFAHLKADISHNLVFITTQYSIIIALLVVLQSLYSMRKRQFAQMIGQIVTDKAHSIRATLSSVSLGRQSYSSLEAAAEQQHHATNSHVIKHEPTIDEEDGLKKKKNISSPAIVITEPTVSINHGATSSDETEPFLKGIPSKNHVHFLLGTGEGSDDDDDDHEHEATDANTALSEKDPYDDQANAISCMAHILDTNKPWSRHSQHTSPV